MDLPKWDDPGLKAGVMVRGALWLIQVVGEGNAFTKEDIRRAFPGVAQADRRIRDLRDYGWVLPTRREDASLTSEQTRFVAPGAAVWDPRARRQADPRKTISNRERLDAMSADNYMCRICGISGAEEYADDPAQTAVLSVMRLTTVMPDESENGHLATVCKRCSAGTVSSRQPVGQVVDAALALPSGDLHRLQAWTRLGRRELTELDRVWAAYLRLPKGAREEVVRALKRPS